MSNATGKLRESWEAARDDLRHKIAAIPMQPADRRALIRSLDAYHATLTAWLLGREHSAHKATDLRKRSFEGRR
ncbi:hypothetical protein GCM10023085_62030 [Actinomadura viridis]|uniref:Uncharacterized protein n=1 Tax=Actinomadura viridis TaxID=58110 RepID=A0A931GP90_9ACTN|nr:hypothetical protein [Actinomadura viridis]MBG6090351.1 hypothetical protein [Actinomadura viridis]